MGSHKFLGKWITDTDFYNRKPRNVFHRQLQPIDLPQDDKRNNHILFRKKFSLNALPNKAELFITADDYYKLYINGLFVAQGPAPSYNIGYNYNKIDITKYLSNGENTLAIHTYYQGLINRVWQSGDFRHGLICDLVADGDIIVKSDTTFLTQKHFAYSEMEISTMQTQIFERYDSRAKECAFYNPNFDDSTWECAKIYLYADYNLKEQETKMLTFEKISPLSFIRRGKTLQIDFGATYVGYLTVKAKGKNGEKIIVKQGIELEDDGCVRYNMRCKSNYLEEWLLSGELDELSQFDYKAFRYVELEGEADFSEVYLIARHYPFELKAKMSSEFIKSEEARRIWELCIHSQKYGVQETIQDCVDREKGFYLGDGCYTALAHCIITGNDSMARKLIDDAFVSSFITEGLVTCMDCSFMQEIAEYPLILIEFLLWHYRLFGDKEYLRNNYFKALKVIDFYKNEYEKDGLLQNIDRWCVVEWPKGYQDNYAVDIVEGKICEEAHVSICAYYIHAVQTLNKIAKIIGEKQYLEEEFLLENFMRAFYDKEKHLFYDGVEQRHISLVGNAFPFAFGLCPDENFEVEFLKLLETKGFCSTSFFTSFPILYGFVKRGDKERIKRFVLDNGTWKRMLDEGATATFEGWHKEMKWNTSLFHLTLTDVLIFLADIDLKKLFA